MMPRSALMTIGLGLLTLTACSSPDSGVDGNSSIVPGPRATCAPDAGVLTVSGSVTQTDTKRYLLIPFQVDPATSRVEVGYLWSDNPGPPSSPFTQTVFDLGLWDADGYRVPEGFRGWSGSRQGRIANDQPPVFVDIDTAERGYVPGPIEPGEWYVDLGIAAVSPQGANWEVQIECLGPSIGITPASDPVDPNHIANGNPGWYHADFHMHGFHSQSNGPDNETLIAESRAADLDILFVTEYVTGQHWHELGATQRAHPDLLIWPGREIITYFGHANTLGESPSVLEYRHGFEGVSLADIQQLAVNDGVLFQVNHPTTFEGPLFENFCRGCPFMLSGDVDWNLVDVIEVVNAAQLVRSSDLGLPATPGFTQNPFTQSAIDFWEERLLAGFRIFATSGSDSKGNEPDDAERERRGYGSSATAIYADELSRAGVREAILAGRMFIKLLGVANSPHLEMTAEANGETVHFGGQLAADSATLTVTITGATGQTLRVLQNGDIASIVPILSDPFTHSQTINRGMNEGPLGTFWRVETHDASNPQIAGGILTTLGNPVFLTGAP